MTEYVRGSTSPPQSLGLHLRVMVGRNQIQQQIGNYSSLYYADGANIQSAYFELEELKVWASNPQETFQRIVISTSGVLVFEGTLPDNTVVKLPVNKMLVLDCEFRVITLTNMNTERVRGNINYVTTRL